MDLPKITVPKAFMQGLIALLLIANFTFMLIAPSILPGYKPPGDALTQTLVNLVILAVGYYLGSSQGSARKDELNAQQQDKAMTALAPAAGAQMPVLTDAVKIDDSKPIKVEQVKP
jgi:hypothetical protein